MAKKFLELGYRSPRVNPKGCRFIDIFSKINGYNFQHGANGGEVHFPETGTWVDGYDKERNVVFEYDEKKHYYVDGTLKPKDILRMNDIKNYLGCKVIRYDETRDLIKEY